MTRIHSEPAEIDPAAWAERDTDAGTREPSYAEREVSALEEERLADELDDYERIRNAAVAALSAAIIGISGCATPVETTYRPIVDTKGVDLNAYERDLGECRQYASETWNAQQGAAGGAVAGALFGAAIGALLGVRGNDLAQVAGVGALTWGAAGAGQGYRNQTDIVKFCLAQRGYRVLG